MAARGNILVSFKKYISHRIVKVLESFYGELEIMLTFYYVTPEGHKLLFAFVFHHM